MTVADATAARQRPAAEGTSASVIIVSHGRPDALVRCVLGVSQLCHPSFEIVVVADAVGLAAIGDRWQGRIKTVRFDTPNISEARNLGIEHSAAPIVAFIDDDAVPEPTWLCHLTRPFAEPDVAAAGGFVIGRNGISHQWKARTVTPEGRCPRLDVDPARTTVLTGGPRFGIKTEGTNMAFRRAILAEMGGFDSAYRFYLDEADVNLRIGRAGAATAIVPLAEVHHGYAASARRRGDRVPRDLSQIAASLAVFLRRHREGGDHDGVMLKERHRQRVGLLRHMVTGGLEPRDLRRLLSGFDAGWRDGMARPLGPLAPLGPPRMPFLGFLPRPLNDRTIVGRRWQKKNKQKEAAAAVAAGDRVSLYIFDTTARYHHVGFSPAGFWVQTGGVMGRSDRADPIVRAWTFRTRLLRERQRVWTRREGCQEGNKDEERPFVREDSIGSSVPMT